MTNRFERLRDANIKRQKEWTGCEYADIAFRALEVAGEAGEVAGAVKKMIRAERGICGDTRTVEDLADEIGDTVISLDLLARDLGLPPLQMISAARLSDGNLVSLALRVDTLGGEVAAKILAYCDLVGKADHALRIPSLVDHISISISQMLGQLDQLASMAAIDLRHAVALKFNKTSVKYGLSTTMGV